MHINYLRQIFKRSYTIYKLLTINLLLLQLSVYADALSNHGNNDTPDESAKTETTQDGIFRIETIDIPGGSQLLTIFGESDSSSAAKNSSDNSLLPSEIPLITILRDTMQNAKNYNNDPTDDRLRYVWIHTYDKPGIWENIAAAIPFLYNRVGKGRTSPDSVPSPVFDLGSTQPKVWKNLFQSTLLKLAVSDQGFLFRSPARAYGSNLGLYQREQILKALAVLSLYETSAGTPMAFNGSELKDTQARLILSDKLLGSIVDAYHLERVYDKDRFEMHDARGHNWELLRQRAEAEGLYFEPIQMPNGVDTHAILWIDRAEVKTPTRKFNNRFLNIAAPWNDDRLIKWNGYTETRYLDGNNSVVPKTTPGARAIELIPLAIYGLDHPKVPALLVDFRNTLNPKLREVSRRVLDDVVSNIFTLSGFGNPYYFIGRHVYDFLTGRRGIDINQQSRLRSYAELKLLLSLSNSINPDLRENIVGRLNWLSTNPIANQLDHEQKLAWRQYNALIKYAKRETGGLSEQIAKDRSAEMTSVAHTRRKQVLFKVAYVASLGIYTRREKPTPELIALLEEKRRLDYHTNYLYKVAKSSPQVEVVADMNEVRKSLLYISNHGAGAPSKTVTAIATLFRHTEDDEMRRLCLLSLYRINNEDSKSALIAVRYDPNTNSEWQSLANEYIQLTTTNEQPPLNPPADTPINTPIVKVNTNGGRQ